MPAADKVGPGHATRRLSTGEINIGIAKFGGSFEFWFELALASPAGSYALPVIPEQFKAGATLTAWGKVGHPCEDPKRKFWCYRSLGTVTVGGSFRARPFEMCARAFGEDLCIRG
jgi:hypothetical protein